MTGELAKLETIELSSLPPVPSRKKRITAGDYGKVPVDSTDPRYTEELVSLSDHGVAGVSYYNISDGSNPPYMEQLIGSLPRLFARSSVVELLKAVNRRLQPLSLELFVWDAFRPISTQRGIWDFFERRLREENPSDSDAKIYEEVIKYVSDPKKFRADDSSTWPTHMTGASVDLTIRDFESGDLLDMGAHFDQMDESAHSDHFEQLLVKGVIEQDDSRLLNRRLLYFVMNEVGFTNYPLEFWHFDWGNQMYQMVRSASSDCALEPAFFGISTFECELP